MAIPRENWEHAERERLLHQAQKQYADYAAQAQRAMYDAPAGFGLSGLYGQPPHDASGPSHITYPRYITVESDAYDALKDKVIELSKGIAERDELMEAVLGELTDIEALREENEALKAKLGWMECPASGVEDADGWIEWFPTPISTSPVPPETKVAVWLRCYGKSRNAEKNCGPASWYDWQELKPNRAEIIAYKVLS